MGHLLSAPDAACCSASSDLASHPAPLPTARPPHIPSRAGHTRLALLHLFRAGLQPSAASLLSLSLPHLRSSRAAVAAMPAPPAVELFSTSILSNHRVRHRHERYTSVLRVKQVSCLSRPPSARRLTCPGSDPLHLPRPRLFRRRQVALAKKGARCQHSRSAREQRVARHIRGV
jgi:hypothetical protein